MTNKEVIDTLILTNELTDTDRIKCDGLGIIKELTIEKEDILDKYYSKYKRLGCDCYHILYLLSNMSNRNYKMGTYELIYRYVKSSLKKKINKKFDDIAVELAYMFLETNEEDIDMVLIYRWE